MVFPQGRRRILLLSQVHPDFLPSLYAISRVLRDNEFDVDIFSYASPAGNGESLEDGIRIHVCGKDGGGILERVRVRRHYRRNVKAWVRENPPNAILSICPFSFLEALHLSDGSIPVLFHSFETYDYSVGRRLFASPASNLRNFRALRRLKEAALVSTPSRERSGWLAARAKLNRIPATILNVPYSGSYSAPAAKQKEIIARLVPESFMGRPIVINTGGVGSTQAIRELIESMVDWPSEACLIVTNVRDNPYGEQIRRAAKVSTRQKDILLLPLITRSEMLALQRASSIGVCLLKEEDALETGMPAPNKIGEYLHAGLLVLGVRMSYLDQLERQGVAVLAESLKPGDIGAAVKEAVARVAVPQTKENVLAFARSYYCMEEQLRPILKVLNNVSHATRV